MYLYKMNVTYNAAETWRDPDNIVQVYESFYVTKESLLKGVKSYIQEHFCKKDLADVITLDELEDLSIIDLCSWGKQIKVTKIKVED